MKEFACEYCNYSSNYKHDLKRHSKIHQNHEPSQQQHHEPPQQHHEQWINTKHGYPVQALNVANNIQVPPTAKQIINIQSPSTTAAYHSIIPQVKKPIIHNNIDNSFFDIRLKENFKIFISGPSRSGKTVFVKEFLQNIDIFCKSTPKVITLVYKVFQPIYQEMGVDHLVQDGDGLRETLMNIANGESMLLIFDDLINSESLTKISDLFVVDGRHMNLSMIFISQKLFLNNDSFREISQNCDYYVLFKNPRNSQEIRTLAAQMSPGKLQLISYYTEATKNPFSYLFINLTQECQSQVKYLSHLFNAAHSVNTYSNSGMKELTDGLNHGRTNFAKMFFKNNLGIKSQSGTTSSNTVGTSTDAVSTNVTDTSTEPISSNTFGTSTESLSNRTVATSTEPISSNTIGTSTESLPSKTVSTSTESIHDNTVATSTEPLSYKSIGTSTEPHPSKSTGTSTEPLPSKNIATSTEPISWKDVSVSTNAIIRKDANVSTDAIPSRDASILTNSITKNDTSVSTNTIPRNIDTNSTNNNNQADYRSISQNSRYPEYDEYIDDDDDVTMKTIPYESTSTNTFPSNISNTASNNIQTRSRGIRHGVRYRGYNDYDDDVNMNAITYKNDNIEQVPSIKRKRGLSTSYSKRSRPSTDNDTMKAISYDKYGMKAITYENDTDRRNPAVKRKSAS
jgi:hypothetical protein